MTLALVECDRHIPLPSKQANSSTAELIQRRQGEQMAIPPQILSSLLAIIELQGKVSKNHKGAFRCKGHSSNPDRLAEQQGKINV